MCSPPETFESPSITLRRVTPADALSLYAIARDPAVMRYMDWPMPSVPSVAAAHVDGALARWNAGSEFQWLIERRSSGECVGTISFRPKGAAVDFGYFLAREYWGLGYACDAATLLLDWFAAQPAITRLWATVDAENSRSRRLLERLGLQLERVESRATVRPNIGGSPRDTAIYARPSNSTQKG